MRALRGSGAAFVLLLILLLPASAQSNEESGRTEPRVVLSIEGSTRLLEVPAETATHLCLRADPGLIFGGSDSAEASGNRRSPACEISQALAAEIAEGAGTRREESEGGRNRGRSTPGAPSTSRARSGDGDQGRGGGSAGRGGVCGSDFVR